MSQPKSARKRQQQQARTRRHEAKRRAVKSQYKPGAKAFPLGLAHSEQSRGRVDPRKQWKPMGALVKGALARMIARHKLLTMPRPTDDVQQAA